MSGRLLELPFPLLEELPGTRLPNEHRDGHARHAKKGPTPNVPPANYTNPTLSTSRKNSWLTSFIKDNRR